MPVYLVLPLVYLVLPLVYLVLPLVPIRLRAGYQVAISGTTERPNVSTAASGFGPLTNT
jgi:hypothetical protein